MKGVMSKMRYFLVATLAIILVGVTLFGIFGFNQTADYKDSYELKVGIDRKAEGAFELLSESVEEYFDANAKDVRYALQTIDGGKTIILKFNEDVSSKVEGAKEFLQAKFDDANLNVKVSADLYEVNPGVSKVQWKLFIAGGIALVVVFIYALIFEKLAGALATIFSSIVSAIMFIALMGITRIPANPFVLSAGIISSALASILAISTTSRYREEAKNTANEKLSASELVDKISLKEKSKYILLVGFVAVIGIVTAVCGLGYFIWAGAQLILAGVSAAFTAYFGTPLIWQAVKSRKSK